ncbi:phosphodiester glycosidase family protein [Nocardioides sp.]|uniref:phosphodiester glycosidase family protein n=1 Tax=Nocardioides sp. TaxID=35761 RepID=UPI003782D24A
MHVRPVLLVAVAAVCALTVPPALAGPAGPHPGTTRRAPQPRVSSADEPVTTVPARTSRHPRTTTSDEVGWQVAPGVTYSSWRQTDARGPVVAHLLTIDPSTPGLRIDYASGATVRQVATVAHLVEEAGGVAGVNGDFYDIGRTGAPLGVGADPRHGLLHAPRSGWNDAFFLDRRGRPRIGELPMAARVLHHPRLRITNLNSPYVAPGGIGAYTPAWGRTAGYRVVLGQHRRVRSVLVQHGRVVRNRARLSVGRPVDGVLLVGRGRGARLLRDRLPVGSRARTRWSLAGHPRMAISGDHFLVRAGVVTAVDDRVVAPRTAVGIDRSTGDVLLLVVDGRSRRSRGSTMVELADLMVDLGADDALNLDGGGSSTMVGPEETGSFAVLNTPSDGFERRVADALSIGYQAPAG